MMVQSVYELFRNNVTTRSTQPAAMVKKGDAWRDVTWGQLGDVADKAAAALLEHGVGARQMVTIMSNTRIEWAEADMGIQAVGATTVPIYQSNTPDDTQYILNDAGVVLVFCEDESQLKKLRSVRAQIPSVKRVVCFTGKAEGDWEMNWEDFLKLGEASLAKHQAEITSRTQGTTPQDLLTLIYTSGTTGRPKGTMLTHDNMLYCADAVHKIKLITPNDVQYMFLPLAHVFAKVLEVVWLQEAHVMAFWTGDQKKIVDELSEVRPTMMCSVPRIFEKIYAKVAGDMTTGSGLKGMLGKWAYKLGEEMAKVEQQGGTAGGVQWTLAQKLVWSQVKLKLDARFGGRLRFFVSGGAPLGKDVAHFFKNAGVTICEGFGLTETSAASAINLPGGVRIGTVGRALPGTEFRVAGDGELLIRGRGVMKGYWNRAEATAEAIDSDGWFHTGDIGVIDKDGFIRITGRKKEIIVTAGGKNVAPTNLENTVKAQSPVISQVVVHGDKRKFLSAVITLDEEALKAFAQKNAVPVSTHAAMSQHPTVLAEVDRAMKALNAQLASYETVKKWKVLDHDFTIGDKPEEKDKPGAALLTASLKVKRNAVNDRYASIFESFYAGDAGGD
jgi:long-chain acyl-CoA synthetase